jgi:uncharacterized coiled-coil DUF342 family protein
MGRQNQKTVILTVGIIIMLIGGCGGQEQEDLSKSDMIKRERLMAAENKRLTREIEKQKEQLAKRLPEENAIEENKKLRQTIEKLNAQVKRLEEEVKELKGTKKYKKLEEVMEMEKTIRDLSGNALKDFEEITKLREENGNLQTEIAELKKELETHKEPAPPPHTD